MEWDVAAAVTQLDESLFSWALLGVGAEMHHVLMAI